MGTCLSVFSGIMQFGFSKRWNLLLGIPDLYFILVCDVTVGVLCTCLNILPTMALFAKITPHQIEGTMFAFLTGTTNLSYQVIAPFEGACINKYLVFPSVTAINLSSYPTLMGYNIMFSAIGLIFVQMIPLLSDIEA